MTRPAALAVGLGLLLAALTVLAPAPRAQQPPAEAASERLPSGVPGTWLIDRQAREGSWGEGPHRVAETALVCTVFQSSGNTLTSGPRRAYLGRGLSFLVSQQASSGRVGSASLDSLEHVLATLALVQAWRGLEKDERDLDALDGVPFSPSTLRRVCEAALAALEPLQGPGGELTSELSPHVTAWGVLAWELGRDAGLDPATDARRRLRKALEWQASSALLGGVPPAPEDGPAPWVSAMAVLLLTDPTGDLPTSPLGLQAQTAAGDLPDTTPLPPLDAGAAPSPLLAGAVTPEPLEPILWTSTLLYAQKGEPWHRWEQKLLAGFVPLVSGSGDELHFESAVGRGWFGGDLDATGLAALVLGLVYRYDGPLLDGTLR